MTIAGTSTGASPRGWRQKWKRTPPEKRAAAAEALRDLFDRPKVRTALAAALAVSLLAHAATLPFLAPGRDTTLDAVAAGEAGYLRKVLQKDRARKTSRQMQGRVTMPPAPPDPEAVVSETLTRGLSSDIEKVVGNLLAAKVTAGLTDHVKTSLKDELARAARDIADGRLSEEQIRQLQDQMKRKAHELAVEALKTHRIKTQVKRAQISVTQWYEKDVSKSLMGNIQYEVFRLPHKGAVWQHAYAGMYFGQFGKDYNWSQARALHHLHRKIGGLRRLASGLEPGGYEPAKLGTWPEPGLATAEALRKHLRALHSAGPSWRALARGGFDKHKAGTKYTYQHLTEGLLKEFYPHRAAEMGKAVEAVSAVWDKALAAAAAYVDSAGGGASGAALKTSHDGCVAAIKELIEAMGSLRRIDEGRCRTVNAIVRSRVLRGPQRERVYERLVGKLTGGLAPLIQDFAVGQFEEGIIKWDKSAEEAMTEFPKMILPLLRRDVQRLFPKKRFDKLIFHGDYADRSYTSPVTEERRNWPSPSDVEADEKALAAILAKSPELAAYAARRREILIGHFEEAIDKVVAEILSRVLSRGLMFRDLAAFVEGVDFADKVQEKLDARKRALAGRGQDLAKLTKDGVPDTSAAQYALLFGGAKGHGANLVPVHTTMRPAYFASLWPEAVLRGSKPLWPPAAAKWGFELQVDAAKVRPRFDPPTPRFEAIPFLARFPALDGRLGDLAKIRPLILRGGREPVLLYAAWNYQGFFFHYRLTQPAERFYWPTESISVFKGDLRRLQRNKTRGVRWAYAGDHCRLLFDTLDARNRNRGEPHTQEFVIFPRGTDSNPYVPGIERQIRSQRDAVTKEYRGVKSRGRVFPPQPMAKHGPDGSGPYRVTTFGEDGYAVEIFLPRSVFSVPVFAPGWYVGFDCAVAGGAQGNRFKGHVWASASNARSGDSGGNEPHLWGDLLLLGTDPRIVVQRAETGYAVAETIVGGHSYLITVVDPDRNVYLTAADTVVVSAEVVGPAGVSPVPPHNTGGTPVLPHNTGGTPVPPHNTGGTPVLPHNTGGTPVPPTPVLPGDVEVFVLRETGENTGVFRGFLDTQPGMGRAVQGILEVMPGDEVRLGYVDTANSRGKRNVIYEVKLPVVAPIAQVAVR